MEGAGVDGEVVHDLPPAAPSGGGSGQQRKWLFIYLFIIIYGPLLNLKGFLLSAELETGKVSKSSLDQGSKLSRKEIVGEFSTGIAPKYIQTSVSRMVRRGEVRVLKPHQDGLEDLMT